MLDYDISSCPLFAEIDRTEQEAFLSRLVSNRKVIEKGHIVARLGWYACLFRGRKDICQS